MPEIFRFHGYIILTTMEEKKITKIWFDDDYIYGLDEDGNTVRQSLLWYPQLRKATEEQRQRYEFEMSGIGWRELDEDVSFESFWYENAEPTEIQRFFLTDRSRVKEYAEKAGMSASRLHRIMIDFDQPTEEEEKTLLALIRNRKNGLRHIAAVF